MLDIFYQQCRGALHILIDRSNINNENRKYYLLQLWLFSKTLKISFVVIIDVSWSPKNYLDMCICIFIVDYFSTFPLQWESLACKGTKVMGG
jgi:hypothetical protein